MKTFRELLSEKKVPHALDPNKTMKHGQKDARDRFDFDNDGDVDDLDKKKVMPDEITGAEKKDMTKAANKRAAGEKKHTKVGMAYEMKSFREFCEEKDARLKAAGVSGYNKAKRTPSHPTKSHVVVAKEGDKIKTIRFGEQGASTAGDPKDGESDKMKAKRKSFKARHGKNIAKGKMSAAYWADKEKW